LADLGLEAVEVIRSVALAQVPHGFLGRRGGVSQGVVAGLNVGLGADDELEAVRENRRRAVTAVLPDARLATVYQVHSPTAVIVGEPWPEDARPRGDAMVTDRPGVLLGIVTADCAPVLLADLEAGVIGAAHAGWRGARGGVIQNTVAAMERLGARAGRISAAVGPAIAQASYEVDATFRDAFSDAEEDFFAAGQRGRWQFDLAGYVAGRLRSAGVAAVDVLGFDTYADESRFFSFRRATHRAEPSYGRQFSLIGLPR
jgi:YfiH family protein